MATRIRRRKKIEAPFPGLRPFMAGENLIFFGREGQSNELIDRLRENRFLAVLGSSGSGKSSLVRAGLQPDLEGGLMAGVAPNWKIATMRPGDRPIAHLAEELAGLVSDPDDPGFTLIPPATMIMTMLQASSFGLKEAAMGPILRAEENLLVIVDQFEEIFRFSEESKDLRLINEAKAFVRLLLEACTAPGLPIYVVITMRSDFLGECPRFDGLAEAINRGQYLVPRLSRAQMREAITGPIAVFEAEIAPDLVIRILNDIGDNADQLPILQHALMRTWDHHCVGDEICMADYDEIGGLGNALNQHAEEIYEELDRKGLATLVEQLFKSLTQLEGEGKGIRRPTKVGEVCALTGASMAQLQVVVDAFRAPGRTFLMPPADVPLDADTILDISHESFMRLWKRLVQWVREETLSAEEYLRLSRAATEFKLGKVNLWRQPELGIALKWQETVQPTAAWAARYDQNFEEAMAFLTQSQAACIRESAEKEAVLLLQRKSDERRLTVRRLIILILIMGSLLAIAVSALIFAMYKNDEAKHQRAEVLLKADSLRTALIENEYLLDDARSKSDSIKLFNDSLQVQIYTINAQQKQLGLRYGESLDARDSLKSLTDDLNKNKLKLQDANELLQSQNKDKDGLVAAAKDANAKLEARNALLEGLALAEQSLEAPRTETAVLLAMRAYNIFVDNKGDVNDPRIYLALHAALERYAPLEVAHFNAAIIAMKYNPRDTNAYLLTQSGHLLEYHWDNPNHKANATNGVGQLDNRLLQLGDHSKTLFVSDMAYNILVYKSNSCYLEYMLRGGHSGQVTGAVELPGKKTIYSCGRDGRVILWDLSDQSLKPRVIYQMPNAPMESIALDPSGNNLVVGTQNQYLIFSTANIMLPPRSFEVSGLITALSFSIDGKVLVYGMDNGTIGYGDLKKGTKNAFPMHKSRVTGLAFSPDGKYVASGSYDKTLRLWRTERYTEAPIVLKGHEGWVTGLAFSRDSKLLFSVSQDKTMRYWYARSEDIMNALNFAAPKRDFTEPEMKQYNLPDDFGNGGKGK